MTICWIEQSANGIWLNAKRNWMAGFWIWIAVTTAWRGKTALIRTHDYEIDCWFAEFDRKKPIFYCHFSYFLPLYLFSVGWLMNLLLVNTAHNSCQEKKQLTPAKSYLQKKEQNSDRYTYPLYSWQYKYYNNTFFLFYSPNDLTLVKAKFWQTDRNIVISIFMYKTKNCKLKT